MTMISKKIITFQEILKQRKVQIEKQQIQQIYQNLKKNDIKFIDKNSIKWLAKVINRAGKKTGKYDSCYNIKFKAPSARSGTKT